MCLRTDLACVKSHININAIKMAQALILVFPAMLLSGGCSITIATELRLAVLSGFFLKGGFWIEVDGCSDFTAENLNLRQFEPVDNINGLNYSV